MKPGNWILIFAACLLIVGLVSCESSTHGEAGSDSDSDSDGDTDSDGDSDSDGDTDGPPGDLTGEVRSASGFPISGALVYVTNGDGEQIPDEAYCYTCDDMTDKKWTLSQADGSWSIANVPEGQRNLVTRKGFFQRQRSIEVVAGQENQIPVEKTTLPGENSSDNLDQIPNYAVLLNTYDKPEDMLAKMGLADLDTSGHMQPGTEQFHMYNDAESLSSAVGSESDLFASQASLNHYHMIFFPCASTSHNVPMIQEYVSGGGKIYSSCWASSWVEDPYPDVVAFAGIDSEHPGDIGPWDSHGNIEDQEMRDWLAEVAPAENLDNYPFFGGWILINSLSSSSYNTHGVLDDGSIGGPVIPTTWVTDVETNAGHPLTLTFPYDCGKIFFSTYQVVESTPSPEIRAQEWVLIYLFYEVGVCEGDYEVPE